MSGNPVLYVTQTLSVSEKNVMYNLINAQTSQDLRALDLYLYSKCGAGGLFKLLLLLYKHLFIYLFVCLFVLRFYGS